MTNLCLYHKHVFKISTGFISSFSIKYFDNYTKFYKMAILSHMYRYPWLKYPLNNNNYSENIIHIINHTNFLNFIGAIKFKTGKKKPKCLNLDILCLKLALISEWSEAFTRYKSLSFSECYVNADVKNTLFANHSTFLTAQLVHCASSLLIMK